MKNDFVPTNNFGIKPKKLSKDELEVQIKLAKKGDERAFEKILSHKHDHICHVMREFFIQGSEPQDVYQECAIKLINIIDKYEFEKGGFDSFANSSIRKHVITSINREKAKKRMVLNQSRSLDDETKNADGDSMSLFDTISEKDCENFYAPDMFVEMIQNDYENYLVDEICKDLSEMEARVFILRYIDHLSYKQIAKELSLFKPDSKIKVKILDQKAVDNAIWRSKPKIKKTFIRLGLDPGEYLKKNKTKKAKKAAKNKPYYIKKEGTKCLK